MVSEAGDTWYCDGQCCNRKGCKITTVGAELSLKYPHTDGMHKRKEHKQTVEKMHVKEKAADEEEEDDFSGMFD